MEIDVKADFSKKEGQPIRPSPDELEKYLNEWNSLENYVQQENSLKKLFTNTYPLNDNIDDVLIKVCSLNDFYSTNIFSPFTVARHIVKLNIDEKIEQDNWNVVNEIAYVTMKGNKQKNFYSFATKYCSHHKPTSFPIYDSFVEKMLMHFKNADKFYDFNKADLKQYPKYREILLKFRDFYRIEEYDLKQIDKYLWQAGKIYFPKQYVK